MSEQEPAELRPVERLVVRVVRGSTTRFFVCYAALFVTFAPTCAWLATRFADTPLAKMYAAIAGAASAGVLAGILMLVVWHVHNRAVDNAQRALVLQSVPR